MGTDARWVRIDAHVASLYSYRIPDFNSFYALASPVPSPSAWKLGLVCSIIEAFGSPERGRVLFAALRDAPIRVAPPECVASSRVLTKRLKKPKQTGAGFTTSFGIREYLHPKGPVTAWLCTPEETLADTMLAARRLRRLGTTDSLVHTEVCECDGPDLTISARKLSELPLDPTIARGRLTLPLNDLTQKAVFEHFAPSDAKSGAGKALETTRYLLPLKLTKQGANWLLWERAPF